MAPTTAGPQIFDEENRNPYKPSVLKSIIPSKVHKRSPSAGDVALARKMKENSPMGGVGPILPLDHPHAYPQRPLRERGHNSDAPNSNRPKRKSVEKSTGKGLHQKTKSSVSLKSLLKDKDKKETGDGNTVPEEPPRERKPKKTKSSTSLSAIFKKSNRGRKDASKQSKDKENQSPAEPAAKPPSPIWSQLATQPLNDGTGSSPMNDRGRTLDEEMSLYTPRGYSPSKQRNFHDYQQPTLTKRPGLKPRPISDYISEGNSVTSNRLDSSRRPSLTKGWNKGSSEHARKPVGSDTPTNNGERRTSNPKMGSRVMAAISAFSSREKGEDVRKDVMHPREIEGAFEKLLDARNIPHNMRDKMRSLDTNIKADFIRKDKAEHSVSATSKPGSQKGRGNDASDAGGQTSSKATKTRPRSLTFTISKGESSPTKKHKSGSGHSHKRNKSVDMPRPPSSRSLAQSGSMSAITSDPTDFIHYLREVQKPEIIEVGKLHKLRILLRNETVAWVDSFISNGGMDEIVGLLYRIMKVEWREEHEDSLLHETLLCLKALCTTSVALQRLLSIESTLFPALLGMLFDEEKKGPSEFTTRGIIISLLFTHLSTASPDELHPRALRIISYLKDPSPPEENQPLNFIASIYQPRPYRVWCKEISNVCKEVFWIFLHHFNVIAINKPTEDAEGSTQTFAQRNFPPPHPPVPAAPHVGGVEWDATTYLATHLDLMNGLIAALPTREERNTLRTELRSSGIEKTMGGSMRTCKEKFHAALHDSLRTWVSAAAEDGWDHCYVREGPPRDDGTVHRSPVKSPRKKVGGISDDAPKLDLPVSGNPGAAKSPVEDGGWL
ncbi:hypothetical protein FQN54_000282 [Arachnomyces sp. PD_36]|nr:hypothetical protein FQN54_000282 [Arachnomyces sp. PD_36]